jgi:hypothetical protein
LEDEIAPRLSSLIIHMGHAKDEFDSFSHKHYELFNSAAPLLFSVEMLGISLHSCQPPLGALTRLDICVWDSTPALSCDELLEVFAAMAPTLTDLQLEGIIFRVESGYELFAIDFPALVSMDIRYPDYFDDEEEEEDDRNYISNLWDCINAPALESVRLDCINDEQFHAVMASLRRQRINNATVGLKSLRLFEFKVGDYAEDLALACPNISDLRMTGDGTDPVLKFILETNQNSIASNTEHVLFPNLHTLSVGSYDYETLSAFVLVRNTTGHPLIKLVS